MKRGRKQDDTLPPSRSREIQRAFRQRRSDYIRGLEQRVEDLEMQVDQLLGQLGEPPRYAVLGSVSETSVARKKIKAKGKNPLPNFIDLGSNPALSNAMNLSPKVAQPDANSTRRASGTGSTLSREVFVDHCVEASCGIYEQYSDSPCCPNSLTDSYGDSKSSIPGDSSGDIQQSLTPPSLSFQPALHHHWGSPSQVTSSTHSGRSSPFGVSGHHHQPLLHQEKTTTSQPAMFYPGLETTLSSQARPMFLMSSFGLQRSVTEPTPSTRPSFSSSPSERPFLQEMGYDCYQSPPDIEATSYSFAPTDDLPLSGPYPAYDVYNSPNDHMSHISPYRNQQTSPFVCSAGPMQQPDLSECHLVADGYLEDEEGQRHHPQFVYHSTTLKPAFNLSKSAPDVTSGFTSSSHDLTKPQPVNTSFSESLSSEAPSSIGSGDAPPVRSARA